MESCLSVEMAFRSSTRSNPLLYLNRGSCQGCFLTSICLRTKGSAPTLYDEQSPVMLKQMTAGGGSQHFGAIYTGNCISSGLTDVLSNIYVRCTRRIPKFPDVQSPPTNSQAFWSGSLCRSDWEYDLHYAISYIRGEV